jgi:uncharacterized Ntn-hydrolase superfamily protein
VKLWLFHFSITHRDQILAEIDETLRKAGVDPVGSGADQGVTTGVQILADRYRRAVSTAQGLDRRVYEQQQSIDEYERVFLAMKAQAETQVEPLPPVDEQRTPIEQAARDTSGIDLPMTQRTPVYCLDGTVPPEGLSARQFPAVSDTRRDPVVGRIAPTELEKDKRA